MPDGPSLACAVAAGWIKLVEVVDDSGKAAALNFLAGVGKHLDTVEATGGLHVAAGQRFVSKSGVVSDLA